MQARVEIAADKRRLVIVRHTPWSEDPANAPEVEVVFEVERPSDDDFTLFNETAFLSLLSSTRTDTRESVTLPPDELKLVKRTAAAKAAEDSPDW